MIFTLYTVLYNLKLTFVGRTGFLTKMLLLDSCIRLRLLTRDFYILWKLVFCSFISFICFYNNNPIFSDSENVYLKSYPYSPYCALPLRKKFEWKSWFQQTYWWKNNRHKPSWKLVQEVQIRRYKPRRWRNRSMNRHFWQLKKRKKAWQREYWPKTYMSTVRPSFVVSKRSEKYGNLLDRSLTNFQTPTEPKMLKVSHTFCSETSKLHSWIIWSLGMSLFKNILRKFCVSPKGIPKDVHWKTSIASKNSNFSASGIDRQPGK